MPCYTITSVKLELKNANTEWLKRALKEMGYSYVEDNGTLAWVSGSYKNPVLDVQSESEGREIKRAYSRQMVQAIAGKFKWRVRQTDSNKFQIQKG